MIAQTFRDFDDTSLRPPGPNRDDDFEADVRSIRKQLDTTSWMFQQPTPDIKTKKFGHLDNILQGQNKTPYMGKLKVKCLYCSTDIQTTYQAHRSLMARMQGQQGSKAPSAQVKYICKSCHSAGLKVPVTQEEKAKIEKWKAMLRKKRANEAAKAKRLGRKVDKAKAVAGQQPAARPTYELCPYCGETFKSGKVFEYHTNKELGINPYKCTVAGCDHAEFSPAARQRHLANKHGVGECQLTNFASALVLGICIVIPSNAVGFSIHEVQFLYVSWGHFNDEPNLAKSMSVK